MITRQIVVDNDHQAKGMGKGSGIGHRTAL
jgi:hypothetical protein